MYIAELFGKTDAMLTFIFPLLLLTIERFWLTWKEKKEEDWFWHVNDGLMQQKL